MSSYYEILGCERGATFEELKKSYQELVKKFHPDKGSTESREEFLHLDKAWKTLRDPVQRKAYDENLSKNDLSDSPLYCTVLLSEMTYDSTTEGYYYACRCGGIYSVCKNEIKDVDEVRISCDECSFHITVNKS